jgi:hypothetical protein
MQSTPPNWNCTISFFLATRDKQGSEFTQKRHVADDHQIAADLFKRFFRCGNLIFWPEACWLYEPSPKHLGQQFPARLRHCFAAIPNGVGHKLQRAQKIGNAPHLVDSSTVAPCRSENAYAFSFSSSKTIL